MLSIQFLEHEVVALAEPAGFLVLDNAAFAVRYTASLVDYHANDFESQRIISMTQDSKPPWISESVRGT